MRFQRILFALVLIAFIIFACYVALFMISFGGGPAIASYMPLITTVVLIALVTVRFARLYPVKKTMTAFGIYVAICLIITAIYQVNKYYHNSIPVVSTEINLKPYEPFVHNTRAVDLGTPSTLKITDSLPVMDGATALYPLYSAFARAAYPEKTYNADTSEVRCTNTPDAYINLINRNVDVIFVARPSKEQRESATSQGVELILTPIGKEAFVFFVNAGNKVNELKLQQIKDIYSGKILNWNQVGGSDKEIRAFQRPEGSGSQTMLQHVMEGSKLATPETEDRPSGMGGIIKETADYKNYNSAIGFSFLFYATEMVKNKEIKVLRIDGIPASRTTIQNGTYPLTAEFYAVTRGNPTPNTQKLIDWIQGKQGQLLVEKTGYTPLK